jgi:Protein of unknown function (DUF3455)
MLRVEREQSMRTLILAGVALSALAMQSGLARAAEEPPATLNPDKLSVYIDAAATGVQIYTCSKNPAGAWAWTFKAPEAALSDHDNKAVAKHYAGPTWEGPDGGKVVGAVKTSMPAPGAGDIPWLLLDIKSREGSGRLTEAKAIVRMATHGGTAPAQACGEAQSGQESRVPYTASYLFLK